MPDPTITADHQHCDIDPKTNGLAIIRDIGRALKVSKGRLPSTPPARSARPVQGLAADAVGSFAPLRACRS